MDATVTDTFTVTDIATVTNAFTVTTVPARLNSARGFV